MSKQTYTIWKCDCCGAEHKHEWTTTGDQRPLGWGELTFYTEPGWKSRLLCEDCYLALHEAFNERFDRFHSENAAVAQR